ncbi:amino-acid racemase [Vibrio alfacsensis]|uniref:amino-acid racemase n=1 Tax=Vibrio alfacsensis TaxID=1074311 RepID=UPI00406841F6
MKPYDLYFLHTSPVHIQPFSDLIADIAPALKVEHFADASLLDRLVAGEEIEIIKTAVQEKVRELASQASLVVCTCSSIGSFAESLISEGVSVQRIDRAMGDIAATHGRVLLLAALETTIQPSLALLETSKCNRINLLDTQVAEGAWERFTNKDNQGYYHKIKTIIEQKANEYDVIVLAQASMAGAAPIADVDIPVLSSPRLGVERAVETIRKMHANSELDSALPS